MKKLLTILMLLIVGNVFSQQDDTAYYVKYPGIYGLQYPRVWATKVMRVPNDTIYSKSGVAIKSGVFYYGNGTYWQTPVSTPIDTTNKWVQLMYTSPGLNQDTLFMVKNGVHTALKIFDEPDGKISGGLVTYSGTGLVFDVSPAIYRINGIRYTSTQTQITLNASDPSNPRRDAIALDATGVIKITGTAAASPADPQVTSDQIALTFISVAAGATTPSGLSTTTIWDENTEWTGSASGVTANFTNTTNPFHLTRSVDVGSFSNGQSITFTNGSPVSFSSFTTLKFYIRLKATFAQSAQLQVSFQSGGVNVTNVLSIVNGSFGYSRTVTGSYQTITIPMSSFTPSQDAISGFKILLAGSNASGFYIDWIQLQGGIIQGGGTTSNGWGVVQSQSGTATSTIPNDILTVTGAGGTTTSASGKTITITSSLFARTDSRNTSGSALRFSNVNQGIQWDSLTYFEMLVRFSTGGSFTLYNKADGSQRFLVDGSQVKLFSPNGNDNVIVQNGSTQVNSVGQIQLYSNGGSTYSFLTIDNTALSFKYRLEANSSGLFTQILHNDGVDPNLAIISNKKISLEATTGLYFSTVTYNSGAGMVGLVVDTAIASPTFGRVFRKTAAAGGGVTTIGTINGGTEDANGANISGTTLYMQDADGTFPGLLTVNQHKRLFALQSSANPTGTITHNQNSGGQHKITFTSSGGRTLAFSNLSTGDITLFQFDNTSGGAITLTLPSNAFVNYLSAATASIPTNKSSLSLSHYDGTNYWFLQSESNTGITALTGDVTATGPGSSVATIANDAVTYAKMQNVGANSILGRVSTSSGDLSEISFSASQLFGRGATGDIGAITLGTNLSFSGTTLNAAGGSGLTINSTAITSGTSGRILFENSSNQVSQSANLFFDVTNTRLGVGLTPSYGLHIQSAGVGDINSVGLVALQSTAAYNSGAGAGIMFRGKYNAGGTYTSMANIFGGKENVTDGDYGGVLSFYTREFGGSTNNVEALRVTSTQYLQAASRLYIGSVSTAPTSTLQTGGSFAQKYTGTATGITLDITHGVVEVTATGQTITLPTAASITGRCYTIKLTASGSATVATTSSQTIDGSTTYSLASQYKYVTVQSNGSNWIVIANN